MDRRNFLKAAAIGSVVAVGVMEAPAAVAAPKPSMQGYKVGDTAADFSGYDQYLRQSKLSDNLGYWTLIDLCPLWCEPCNQSAQNQRAFADYINGNGIPFRMQPVVVEGNLPGVPSSRLDAERWAVAYGLEKFNVLHDNGDLNSPLHQLVTLYAAANNNSQPAFPSYILVDPAGTIRQYLTGGEMLDTVQSFLAAQTGKTLNLEWFAQDSEFLIIPVPSYGPSYLTAAATYRLGDDTPVSDSGTFSPTSFQTSYAAYTESTSVGSFTSYGQALLPISTPVTINLWDVLGPAVTVDADGSVVAEDPSKLFDLHSPITVTVGPQAQFSRTYNRLPTSADIEFAVAYEMPSSDAGPAISGGVSGAIGWVYGAPVTQNADGSMTIGPFTPSDSFDNGSLSNVATISASYSKIEPYQAAINLENTVSTDSELSRATQVAVAALLEGGRAQMAGRDFAAAASKFAKAKTALQGAAANAAEIDSADWITAHVTWLATH